MRILLHSFVEPEENIACEEYFFNKLSKTSEELIRIWESPIYFIVIGSSQRVSDCVNVDNCKKNKIKIIRRCSAGGAVLQGPGCINYSIYFDLNKNAELRNIQHSYNHILGKVAKTIFDEHDLFVEIKGISDLVYLDRKVGGNAQRRNNRILLHHGTILWNVNYHLMEETLKVPNEQPDYRRNRSHREFVGFLPISREQIIDTILKAFAKKVVISKIDDTEISDIKKLATEKYSKEEWNFRK